MKLSAPTRDAVLIWSWVPAAGLDSVRSRSNTALGAFPKAPSVPPVNGTAAYSEEGEDVRPTTRRRLLATVLAVGLGTAMIGVTATGSAAASTPTVTRVLAPGTRFYVDPASEQAQQALTDLLHRDVPNAVAMAKLASWPEAVWYTKGTPSQVKDQVRTLVRRATAQRAVPVLVAYNIPLRDCSQFSAGGAQSDADYQTWIAALASGLGNSKAVVILEPDALANLPSDCNATTDPTGAISAARIADIRYAVGVLEAQPGTSVYLDAGHSQWHSTGDMAARLIQAGVAQTQGFFLNVSNFQPTDQLDQYGTWISKCIWFATKGPDWAAGHTDYCASQYYSGAAPNDGLPGDAVSPTDPSTWHWTDLWFDQNAGTPPLAELTHFVVDTSRNGQGAWTPAPGAYTGDAQTWCNPPGRGVGVRPTANTDVALVDAYLYVKTIGESDGQCNRGIPGGTIDPEYGSVDPAAGAFWPEQAHSLAHNASPALTINPHLF
jgi:endoglucanase